MKDKTLSYDIISILSFISTIIAIITSLLFPNILETYFWQIIAVTSLVVASVIINFFKKGIEDNTLEIRKLKERLDINNELIDLKAKVLYLLKMKDKRGKEDLLELIIRIIQIGAIIFTVYIIIKAIQGV